MFSPNSLFFDQQQQQQHNVQPVLIPESIFRFDDALSLLKPETLSGLNTPRPFFFIVPHNLNPSFSCHTVAHQFFPCSTTSTNNNNNSNNSISNSIFFNNNYSNSNTNNNNNMFFNNNSFIGNAIFSKATDNNNNNNNNKKKRNSSLYHSTVDIEDEHPPKRAKYNKIIVRDDELVDTSNGVVSKARMCRKGTQKFPIPYFTPGYEGNKKPNSKGKGRPNSSLFITFCDEKIAKKCEVYFEYKVDGAKWTFAYECTLKRIRGCEYKATAIGAALGKTMPWLRAMVKYGSTVVCLFYCGFVNGNDRGDRADAYLEKLFGEGQVPNKITQQTLHEALSDGGVSTSIVSSTRKDTNIVEEVQKVQEEEQQEVEQEELEEEEEEEEQQQQQEVELEELEEQQERLQAEQLDLFVGNETDNMDIYGTNVHSQSSLGCSVFSDGPVSQPLTESLGDTHTILHSSIPTSENESDKYQLVHCVSSGVSDDEFDLSDFGDAPENFPDIISMPIHHYTVTPSYDASIEQSHHVREDDDDDLVESYSTNLFDSILRCSSPGMGHLAAEEELLF